jgi:gamma-glutamylcyclotransferase (GGCT)/AIG2-like uncharacterized protein YtfP
VIHHLFLYGTLLPELSPASLRGDLARLEPVGTGYVAGRLYDLGAYPGLVLDRQSGVPVKGELFRLAGDSDDANAAILESLDQYEDAVASDERSGLFTRACEAVRMPDASEVPAWIYLYQRDTSTATLIEHGDYRRWLRERNA